MSSDRGRYSKVSRRIWNSPSFDALSKPKACGGWLFFRLLTGPELTNIPGLFQCWEAGLAQSLGWSLKDFRKAFAEVSGQGMAKADWKKGLIWLPAAIEHNEPESPNVVTGWRSAWQELPECETKVAAYETLLAWAKAKGEAWVAAFEKATGKAPPKPSPKQPPPPPEDPSPNQEQEQEQKQEQEQEQKEPAAAADSDREMPIALNFQLHPASVSELSRTLGYPEPVILEAVREFVGYWTIGGGANKARSHWQARCRDDIRRKKERGELDKIARKLGAETGEQAPKYGTAEDGWAV